LLCGWFGLGAPKATPAEIVDKLNNEINAGLADPKLKARMADLGGTPLPGSPADFGKFIANEIEKWGQPALARADPPPTHSVLHLNAAAAALTKYP
jgi:tripartite-type tricarboxylate transporter receptor subunit TctC